jgi:ABC-type uncharacterized transport system permease subunit
MDGNGLIQLFAVTLAFAAPLIFAAMGELVSERSGVVNIELEGMMLAGAFCGVWAALVSDSLVLGFVGGAAAGMLVGALHGTLCFVFKAEQVVSGIVLNILVLGLTTYALAPVFGSNAGLSVPTLTQGPITGISERSGIGPILFNQNLMVYAALLLVPLIWWVMQRTTFGLAIQASGEKPAAAISMGVDVQKLRWIALLMCGGLAGIGGAQLTLAGLGAFTQNVTAGRGFVALAAVVFGQWRPAGALIAVLLFTLTEAVQVRAQLLGVNIPYQFLVMAPYVVTVVALALLVKRSRAPAALGTNPP